MRRLWTILLAGILIAALLLFARSNFWSLEEIKVEGNRALSAEMVIGLSGLTPGQNLLSIKVEEVRQHLLLHPRVRAAEVERHPPCTVILRIEERLPVAAVPLGDSFYQVDEVGTVLEVDRYWDKRVVPLVTGMNLPAEKPLPGQRLVTPEMGSMLAVIKALSPEVRGAVQEVHFGGPQGTCLYTIDGVQVCLGNLDNLENKLVMFWAIYRQQAQEGKLSRLAYIDVCHPRAPALRYAGEGE